MYLRNIVFGMDRRTFMTVISVSIAVMFIVTVSTVVYSFQHSSQRVVEKFKTSHYLLMDDLLDEPTLSETYPNATYMLILPAEVNGVETYIVGVVDPPGNVVSSDPGPGEAYITWKGGAGQILSVRVGSESLNLTVVGSVRSLFPEGYVIANITDVWFLYPSTRGLYNAVLLSDRVEGAVSLPSMVDFFGLSSEEVASDIYLIYAISFLSVFFLTNALLHLEAVRQRRTISIVRAMGGGRSVIVLSFAGKALVVSLLGSLLGTSLGIMTSYALVTYLTVTGYFEVFVPIHHLGMAFVLTMVASMASSALPIREALSVPPMGIIRGGATR